MWIAISYSMCDYLYLKDKILTVKMLFGILRYRLFNVTFGGHIERLFVKGFRAKKEEHK